MADTTIPMLLNKGLDLVTPPLLAEPGALLDCLNYEIAADIGYKRIDGYERRDGWPTGGISRFYAIVIEEAFAGSSSGLYNPGDPLYSVINDVYVTQGVVTYKSPVVEGQFTIHYIPSDNTKRLRQGDLLMSTNDIVQTTSQDGREIITDPEDYLDTIRGYSSILRLEVEDAPAQIAGLTYSRDRHYEVLNTAYLRVYDPSGVVPKVGDVVRYRGSRYRFLGARFPSDPNPNFKGEWHFIALDIPAFPNNNDIVSMSSPGPGTYASAQSELMSTQDSYYGTLYYLDTPSIAGVVAQRERIPVSPAITFTFNQGGNSSADGPPLTNFGAGEYFLTDSGGFTLLKDISLTQVVQDGGDFTLGTATGRMQIAYPAAELSAVEFVDVGFEIHNAYPTTGTSKVARVSANIEGTLLAGTGALRANNTRYLWGTYNFYGHPDMRHLYGVNGVTRAFWASPEYYGNIYTQADATLDNPKYIAFHAGVQLALGFAAGSVQLSVGGLPYDFSGVRGALETATGDDVTGLLESQNDSTIIFGRRTIRRVTGTTDTTLALETIAPAIGALDYTACNVGTQAVMTTAIGIMTLSAAVEYGDFIGATATAPIYNWLQPKIVPEEGQIEIGGVACAFACRGKNQYRLFLNSGDVVNVTFTSDGPKPMLGSYRQDTQVPLIPLAWSSQVGDNNREYLEVVWDDVLGQQVATSSELTTLPNNRAYQLDTGWGFDGDVFRHYFDVAYTFLNNGVEADRVSKVRAYGLGYGVATLDLKASGIEQDFDLPYSSRIQPINMPSTTKLLYSRLRPVMGIVDHQNWGFGVKIRLNGTVTFGENVGNTEPSHIIQVLVMYLDGPGAQDA